MSNVIKAEHRLKTKKNRELDPLLDEKANTLKDWFASRWPEAELHINFHFSRNVGEELRIKRQIVCVKNPKMKLTSLITLNHNTWSSSYYMEKFLTNFVKDQKNKIESVMSEMYARML